MSDSTTQRGATLAFDRISILGIPGSLRRGSLNRALLRVARDVAPEHVDIQIYDISDIPLYNADVQEQRFPEPVQDFKRAIAEADALLFACPEYNYSYSGVLKNAIDWASRPLPETPFRGKFAAIMGVSGGASGTIRAQSALRPVLGSVGVFVIPKPEVVVRNGRQLFDENGHLEDEATRDQIRQQVETLAEWARIHRRAEQLASR
jgi:chromate reductase, NAD(P)H dehydrogenase (quinone)